MVATSARRGIKACGRSHHHCGTLIFEFRQAPTAEFLGIVYRQFGYRIERPHRDRRVDTGYAVQSVDEALTALHVFVIHIAIVFLGGIKRCLCYYLSDEGR